jgi:hypothetical protein
LSSIAQVLTEGFESDPTSRGWSSNSIPEGNNWSINNGTNRGPNSVFEGTNAAMFNNYSFQKGVRGILESPEFNLKDVKSPELTFYWWNGDRSYEPSNLEIKGLDSDGSWINLGFYPMHSSVSWEKLTIPLRTTIKKIQIIGISDYGAKNTFIDDLIIKSADPYKFILSIASITKDIFLDRTLEVPFFIENRGSERDIYSLLFEETDQDWIQNIVDENGVNIDRLVLNHGEKKRLKLLVKSPANGPINGYMYTPRLKVSSTNDDKVTQSVGLSITTLVENKTYPLLVNFNNSSLPLGWQSLNLNHNSNEWSIVNNEGVDGSNSLAFKSNYNEGDDIIATQALYLSSDKVYRLGYKVKGGSSYRGANLSVKIGHNKSQLPDEFNEIANLVDFYQKDYVSKQHTFHVPQDGVYFIGFHTSTSTNLNIDDFILEYAPNYDMGFVIKTPQKIWIEGKSINYDLTITNKGQEADSYDLSYSDGLDGEFLLDGVVVNNIKIESGDSKHIVLKLNAPQGQYLHGEKIVQNVTLTSVHNSILQKTVEIETSVMIPLEFPFVDNNSRLEHYHLSSENRIERYQSNTGSHINSIWMKAKESSEDLSMNTNAFIDLSGSIAPTLYLDVNGSLGPFDDFRVFVIDFESGQKDELSSSVYTGSPVIRNSRFKASSFNDWSDVNQFVSSGWQRLLFDLKAYKGKKIFVGVDYNCGYNSRGEGLRISNLKIAEAPSYISVVKSNKSEFSELIGKWKKMSFSIENKGSKEDTFQFSFDHDGWQGLVLKDDAVVNSFKIEASAKVEFEIKLKALSSEVKHGDINNLSLNIKSKGSDDVERIVWKANSYEALTTPYEENFEDVESFNLLGWKIVNSNDDNKVWTIGDSFYSYDSDNCVWISNSFTSKAMDDWIYSAPVSLEEGSKYRISYFIRSLDNKPEKFDLLLYNVLDQEIKTLEKESIVEKSNYEEKVYEFNVPKTGIYYFGMHGISAAGSTGLAFDNVTIDKVLPNDLKLVSIHNNATSFVQASNDVVYDLEIKNNGDNEQTGNTVRIYSDDKFIKSIKIPIIKKNETKKISYIWNPERVGTFTIRFELSSDDNLNNNILSDRVEVFADHVLLADFEGEVFPSSGWMNKEISKQAWSLYKSDSYRGKNHARLKANYSSSSESRLVTPKIQGDGVTPFVFYTKASSSSNELIIEKSDDGVNFTKIKTVPLSEEYQKIEFVLNDAERTYIAFHGKTEASYQAYISIDYLSGPLLTSEEIIAFNLSDNFIEKTPHSFSDTKLGEKDQSFTFDVSNNGNKSFSVSDKVVILEGGSADQFEITNTLPLTVSPSSKVSLKVRPKAEKIGVQQAKIQFNGSILGGEDISKDIRIRVFPANITGLYPEANNEDVELTPNLSWTNGEGVTKVDLYFSDKLPLTEDDKQVSTDDVFSEYPLSGLKNGTNYFWKVVNSAPDDHGTLFSTSSDVNHFETLLGKSIIKTYPTTREKTGLESLPFSCGVEGTPFYTYSQSIYPSTMFDSLDGKRINRLFYYYNGEVQAEEDIVVYMSNTSRSGFDDGQKWEPYQNLIKVYEGPLHLPNKLGWVAIDLDVPFIYELGQNLLIGLDANGHVLQNIDAGFAVSQNQDHFVSYYRRHHDIDGNPDPEKIAGQDGMMVSYMASIRVGVIDEPTTPVVYHKCEEYDAPTIGLHEHPSYHFKFKNIGVGELQFNDIEIDGLNKDEFSVKETSLSIAENKVGEVVVGCNPRSVGKKNITLVIHHNGPTKVVRIPIRVEVTDAEVRHFPFYEGFEGNQFPVPGWSSPHDSWHIGRAAYSGECAASANWQHKGDAILVTPPIHLPENYQLSFWWRNRYSPEPRVGAYDFTFVEISSDNGMTWNELGTYSTSTYSDSFYQIKIDLSAYANQRIFIRWRHELTPGYENRAGGITIDDILIDEVPYTPEINELRLSIKDYNNVNLEWDVPELNDPNRTNKVEGYSIYRNGKLLINLKDDDFSYSDEHLKRGNYEYYIRVNYEKGSSEGSFPEVVFIDIENDFPPTDLNAEVIKKSDNTNSVSLTWNRPIKKEYIDLFPEDDIYGPAKTGNYSEDQLWVANYEPKGHHEVSMLKFDLEQFQGKEIESVKLRLNQIFMANDHNSEPSKIYAISKDWSEDTFDFSTTIPYDDQKVWGEYYFGSNGWQEVDITALVKAWIEGTIPNYGLCLVAAEGDRLRVFDSKDCMIPENRPHLKVAVNSEKGSAGNDKGHGLGYRIYRNGKMIHQIDDFKATTYTDENLDPNFYTYSVSALYSYAGESQKCDPDVVNVALNDKSAWTWMIYLYEDNTGLDGAEDINELEFNGSVPGLVNYIVLYDSDDDSKDGVYYITKDPEGENNTIVSRKISEIFGVDPRMSDWNTLDSFIEFAQSSFPAERYALTLWDHGNGIFREGDDSERSFVGGMNLWELDKALDRSVKRTGKKIDILGFDLCLLGQTETAYQVMPYANYLIASEKTEPGDGWDYKSVFARLNANPLISSVEMSRYLVTDYVATYSIGGNSNPSSVTQAATDLTVYQSEYIPALNDFARSLINHVYDYHKEIETARELSWYSKRNKDHRDLGHFAKLIMVNDKLPYELKDKARLFYDVYTKTIVENGFTGRVNSTATGHRVWFPKSISTELDKELYLQPLNYLDFSETLWDEFLFSYETPQKNPSVLGVDNSTFNIDAAKQILSINVALSGDAGIVEWEINSNVPWIKIQQSEYQNSALLSITVEKNKGEARDGVLTIEAEGIIGCPLDILIHQDKMVPGLHSFNAEINGSGVDISWKYFGTEELFDHYNIIKDGEIISEISDINVAKYVDDDFVNGKANYCLEIVLKNGEIVKSKEKSVRLINELTIDQFSVEETNKGVNVLWHTQDIDQDARAFLIFRDDLLIARITDLNIRNFRDLTVTKGKHKYYMQMEYLYSVSNKTNEFGINISLLSSIYDKKLNSEISLYPNPIQNNQIHLSVGSCINVSKIEIYNSFGILLNVIYGVNGKREIIEDIDLSSGIYFLKVETSFGVRIIKFIKK